MKNVSHKNLGSFLAFNDEWFSRHQSLLLFLLNHKTTKYWFRWVLRIKRCDIGINTLITEIKSNRFSYGNYYYRNKKGQLCEQITTDFRTHPKYGKRLYFAFKPFWWLIHFWDWAVADRWLPRLSYGFSTLTAYPDAGTGGTTVDGIMSHYAAGSSFATLRAAAGNGSDDTSSTGNTISLEADSTTTMDYMSRAIFIFDTSSIGDTDTVSDAVLSLYGEGKADAMGITPSINIYTSTPASNNDLVNGDYAQVGSTAQCDTAISYAGWSTAGYNDFTFNSTGRGNISKTGVSKFGARNANYDAANSAPSTPYSGTGISRLRSYFADEAGTSKDPKLVVTYSASTAWTQDCNEIVTMVDSISKRPTKVLAEVATIVESFVSTRIVVQVFNEILTITDNLTKTIVKVFNEVATVVEATTKMITKALRETVTMIDSLARTIIKTFTEQLSIVETLNRWLNGSSTFWTGQSKNSSSWSNENKNSSSWTNEDKT